jgi:hypothetical protein
VPGVEALLQLIGLAAGGVVYVLIGLGLWALVRWAARLWVALYWARRERAETRAVMQRVYDVQHEAPRRRAA